MTHILEKISSFVFSPECQIKVNNFDFTDFSCLKLGLAKCLGYVISAGAAFVKMPQILQVMASQSAQGLSCFSLFLESSSCCLSTIYSYTLRYPFSSFGDSFCLALQNSWLLCLSLYLQRKPRDFVVYSTITVLMLSTLPFCSPQILSAAQLLTIPFAISGRLIQIYVNHKNSGTGQLSLSSTMVMSLGALARVFTTIQETGDGILLIGYAMGCTTSGILAFQIIYYGGSNKDHVD